MLDLRTFQALLLSLPATEPDLMANPPFINAPPRLDIQHTFSSAFLWRSHGSMSFVDGRCWIHEFEKDAKALDLHWNLGWRWWTDIIFLLLSFFLPAESVILLWWWCWLWRCNVLDYMEYRAYFGFLRMAAEHRPVLNRNTPPVVKVLFSSISGLLHWLRSTLPYLTLAWEGWSSSRGLTVVFLFRTNFGVFLLCFSCTLTSTMIW